MVAAGDGNCAAQTMVRSGCVCGAVRAGLVFTLLCRAQSAGDVWTPAVVLAGGPEDGGDGARGEDGGGGGALRLSRTRWICGMRSGMRPFQSSMLNFVAAPR